MNEIFYYIETNKTIVKRSEFDADPYVVNVKNGLLDHRTGKLGPHRSDYLSLVQIPVEYNPKAACPNIIHFLYNVFVDPSDVPLFLEFAGYCLFRNKELQKELLLPGPPENGKSKLLELLRTFLGIDNTSSRTLDALTSDKYATADLFGKLANIFADISDRRLADVEAFKTIATCDLITAQRKFQPSFQFYPTAKLIFSTNKPPRPTQDMDDSYYRRWMIIPCSLRKFDYFTKKPIVKDTKLLEKLTTDDELSGFLNLVLVSTKRIASNQRFCKNPSTDEIRDAYQKLNDPVKAWMDDNCLTGPDYEGNKEELHADFIEYCWKRKLTILELNSLGRELVKFNIKDAKTGSGKERTHVWRGIDLKKNHEQKELYFEDV
jgi:putative DNA primase/helicase